MKITLVIVAGIVISSTFCFVAGVNAQDTSRQRGDKPGMPDDHKLRNLQVAKGKAGKKECGCTLNLDFDGVCENQPWWPYLDKGSWKCERFTNALSAAGGGNANIGYTSIYDRCRAGENIVPMEYPYKTGQECYDFIKGAFPSETIAVIDNCEPNPTPSPTKAGKVNKSECQLNISNCTRTCSKDQTAYYLTKNDFSFFGRNKFFGNYPLLKGGCHRFLQDEFEMLSYNRCFKNETMPEKYKNLDACCEAKDGCSEIETDSPVWRIDQCDTTTAATAKENIFATDHVSDPMNCPTYLRCKQCIDDLSTQFPVDPPPHH
jgi:hypothetical protein